MLLVGAAGASTYFVLADRGDRHHYTVSVYLKKGITGGQRTAIEAALRDLHPPGSITFETREQALERYRRMAKDAPSPWPDVTADALPESFQLSLDGPEFDCTPVVPLRRMAGFDAFKVFQAPTEGHPGAEVLCY
jgi:cell division transport system permease protein